METQNSSAQKIITLERKITFCCTSQLYLWLVSVFQIKGLRMRL